MKLVLFDAADLFRAMFLVLVFIVRCVVCGTLISAFCCFATGVPALCISMNVSFCTGAGGRGGFVLRFKCVEFICLIVLVCVVIRVLCEVRMGWLYFTLLRHPSMRMRYISLARCE